MSKGAWSGAGDDSLTPPRVTADQRGLPQLLNGKVDAGASISGFTLLAPALYVRGLILVSVLLVAAA